MTDPNNSVLIKSIIINIDNHFKGQKSNKVSPLVRANYTAFKNWLEKYNPKSGATDMEKVQGYIEALYHSCKLELYVILLFMYFRLQS